VHVVLPCPASDAKWSYNLYLRLYLTLYLLLQLGIGDLTNTSAYNGGNEPHNEPWIYRPEQPKGKRYFKTGVTTDVARLYHATSLLTSAGDIVVVSPESSSNTYLSAQLLLTCQSTIDHW
jgi:hypothetical protein